MRSGVAARKLDFQGDRLREGYAKDAGQQKESDRCSISNP